MRDGSQKTFYDSESPINDVCFRPDGRYIAVGNDSGEVLIWNLRTGELVEKLMGHDARVLSLAFAPDGKGLISGGEDGTVKFWDMSFLAMDHCESESGDDRTISGNKTGKEVLNFRGHTVSLFVAYQLTYHTSFPLAGFYRLRRCLVQQPMGPRLLI